MVEMDHSYSTERDRMQKTDHCYFTVGKKTPQVVLRRAQQLKDDLMKSAIGQDHSYVRAEHAPHISGFESELMSDVEESAQINMTYGQPQQCGTESSEAAPHGSEEAPSEENRMTAAEALLTLDTALVRCSVVDDLRCWIGSIQLDHTYGGLQGSNISHRRDNPNDVDHTYEGHVSDCAARNISLHQLDHAYVNRLNRRLSDCANVEGRVRTVFVNNDDSVAISNGSAEISEKTRCRSMEPVHSDCSDTVAAVKPKAQYQHCDHAYDVNICDPSNFDEFRSDHSYDTKRVSSACGDSCAGQDWWDHAYVDYQVSGSPVESWCYSGDMKSVNRMADFVEGAIV